MLAWEKIHNKHVKKFYYAKINIQLFFANSKFLSFKKVW